jgi:hypothetical protein
MAIKRNGKADKKPSRQAPGTRPDNAIRNKGNEWYKMRTKIGRDKLFESAAALEEACQEYLDYTSKRKVNNIPVPYTTTGLCIFLGVSSNYFNEFEIRLSKKDADSLTEDDKAFIETIASIRQIIYNQKFEGAAVHQYNSNIISRDLGLYDRKMLSGDKENPIAVHQITGMDIK